MNGENRFSTRDVIKTGWHNIKGAKWAIWAPQIVMLLIYLAVAAIFGILASVAGILPKPGMPLTTGFWVGAFVFELVVIFLVSPLVTGIQMVGLKKVRGEDIKGGVGFKYWHKWIPLGFTVLLFTIGSFIINQVFTALLKMAVASAGLSALLGIIAAIVMIVYVAFFMFNMLFVADGNKGPWGALGHSAKMVSQHWFRVILLIIFMGIVMVIAALPAILGLLCPVGWVKALGIVVSFVLMIWVIPYWNLILATIYHRLSGNN